MPDLFRSLAMEEGVRRHLDVRAVLVSSPSLPYPPQKWGEDSWVSERARGSFAALPGYRTGES